MSPARTTADDSSSDTKTGEKRNVDEVANAASSPAPKRGKTAKREDGQQTIEETMEGVDDVEDDEAVMNEIDAEEDQSKVGKAEKSDNEDVKKSEEEASDKKESEAASEKESAQVTETNGESSMDDTVREDEMPSSILEKGIIYFFFRGRVGIEDPQGVDDVARSYIVLRPLPIGAKLSDGPLDDTGNARLLALPKKVLPKSGRDKFLVFVEKSTASIKDLKDFISASDYATKTSGTSHSPSATPIAEGIYAITTTGRESHLAYYVTVPEIGEIQKDLGIQEKGSFVISAKNPTASGPANATLDKGADYPESIMSKFRGLRWMPLEPELLDYDNTQFLVIGEGIGDVDKATAELQKDEKDESKEKPIEEMEKLEDEDASRVKHLKGSDADVVFADLHSTSKDYKQIQTSW